MFIILALPFTEGAAVITGCVGGGEVVPRRGPGGPWLGRPLRRLTVRASQSTRIVSITPPPGHYESGAVGLHGRLPKGAPTSGVGPDGGLENEPHEEPRGAPGDWHPKNIASRSLASCSLAL